MSIVKHGDVNLSFSEENIKTSIAHNQGYAEGYLDGSFSNMPAKAKPTWKGNKAYCSACTKRIHLKTKPHYCCKCGTKIDW